MQFYLEKWSRYIKFCNFSGKVISMVTVYWKCDKYDGILGNRLSFVGFFSALTTWSGGEIYTQKFYKTVATSCSRLHNKAQYPPINLKHLMKYNLYTERPLKMLLTSIKAGTDYLKIEFAPNLIGGIKFKSAFLHWILHCNFSDQRLKIFQTFVE